ncbi:MAG: DHH family phosphoesterase [Planctomycetaceae bacterium]|nr:DHH family phosphoesterase [Planctomycetaceae bacterium]
MRPTQTLRKLADLRSLLAGKSSLLIVLQDNPDPDALAAAMALRKLAHHLGGVQCTLASGGSVGRAENRALVRYLDANVRPIEQIETSRFDVIATVDTQPGLGNNSLPAGIVPQIVIDHHPIHDETRRAQFFDIRSRYGASSTILWEYIQAANLTPEPPLATALLYGIQSDTQDFGREATAADKLAYGDLYPLANKRILGTIQRGEEPTEYYRVLVTALAAANLAGNCIYSNLGSVDNVDMIAEVADLLLRHERADWSLCWGHHDNRMLLSLRTIAPDGRADVVIRHIVHRKGTGGGHHSMAGGQISVAPPQTSQEKLDRLIVRRFLHATGNEKAPIQKLLPQTVSPLRDGAGPAGP